MLQGDSWTLWTYQKRELDITLREGFAPTQTFDSEL